MRFTDPLMLRGACLLFFTISSPSVDKDRWMDKDYYADYIYCICTISACSVELDCAFFSSLGQSL